MYILVSSMILDSKMSSKFEKIMKKLIQYISYQSSPLLLKTSHNTFLNGIA